MTKHSFQGYVIIMCILSKNCSVVLDKVLSCIRLFSMSDDGRAVATPSSHLSSLQLSQHAMLVPETVEDTTEYVQSSAYF